MLVAYLVVGNLVSWVCVAVYVYVPRAAKPRVSRMGRRERSSFFVNLISWGYVYVLHGANNYDTAVARAWCAHGCAQSAAV